MLNMKYEKMFILILLFFTQFVLISRTGSCDTSPSKTKEEVGADKPKEKPAGTLNIQWLINEAMEHNPEIIAVRQRLNASASRISQAKSLEDPMFRAGSFNMSNQPLNINGQTSMLQQRYAVTQKIPFPGKLAMEREIATQES
ncbi:hypothetical protein [Candidatus Kuenenia stuttgartiensis]|uniref:hypothetical protein n=1 Tax=Kuenenia stuttgartiensis TaxID=174633 RepID=UPI00146F7128|nr:hypothetical protein [Candidatus Kuenenia stuttgartiensis]